MTSHHHTASAHPIEAFVRATSSDLAASAEQPLWSVDADGARTLVRDLRPPGCAGRRARGPRGVARRELVYVHGVNAAYVQHAMTNQLDARRLARQSQPLDHG